MTLDAKIRHYREGLNLTLEQLAERSGVDVGTISALENRKSERSKYAAEIARGLGLTLDQLLDEKEDFLPGLQQMCTPLNASNEVSSDALGSGGRTLSSLWPFAQISPLAYNSQLSALQRAQVEGFALGLIAANQTTGQPVERRPKSMIS